MRKQWLPILLTLFLTAGVAAAQELVYEVDGKPLFSVEVTDGWVVDLDFAEEAKEAGTYREGRPLEFRVVEIRPDDGGEAWVGLWSIPGASNLDEAVEYSSGLNRDLFSALEISRPKDTELNGMPARTASGSGTHQGQEVELILVLFEPREGSVAAGLYVGAENAWSTYEEQLRAMAASLAPAG